MLSSIWLFLHYLMHSVYETYMQRCIDLAYLGAGKVTPNPMVGALLVYENSIIGEGYHEVYGGAHAEVNCINSVKGSSIPLISGSTLYVSLEPCTHFGKTPPCSDMIIQKNISKVVIGCLDPNETVDGRGVEQLKKAEINVITGILEKECKNLNKSFFTFHTKHRPYIILKWAQSSNEKIADNSSDRILISNKYTNRLVHQWRSESDAILVGTNTAMLDNPSLTNRFWTGSNPKRMVLDMTLRLPANLTLFDQQTETFVLNGIKQEIEGNTHYHFINKEANIVKQILQTAYQLNIQSILVEGGARLLQSFFNEGLWDEARIICNEKLVISNGLAAPLLIHGQLTNKEKMGTDTINYFTHKP